AAPGIDDRRVVRVLRQTSDAAADVARSDRDPGLEDLGRGRGGEAVASGRVGGMLDGVVEQPLEKRRVDAEALEFLLRAPERIVLALAIDAHRGGLRPRIVPPATKNQLSKMPPGRCGPLMPRASSAAERGRSLASIR